MLVYGLRLFVALITFAVGVTSSWLVGSGCSSRVQKRVVTSNAEYVLTSRTEIQLPKRECKVTLSPKLVEGGILNGRARSMPRPVFPVEAKVARVSGSVPVRVVVDVDGRVMSAQATDGPYMLRQAAEDAAREAVFAPTLLSGNPVKVGGIINYNFAPQ